jgi:transcriptional regulator with XRE-family HTH domain
MTSQRGQDPASRLRQAREQKGLSLRQIAEATKLSVRAIELLEGDAISALPEGIYRRSIVRAVAREVGLDPEQLLADFAARHPDELPARQTPPAAAAGAKGNSAFQKAAAVVSAVLPMVVGVLYFALPMATERSAQPARTTLNERVDRARAEIVPVGGFSETSVSRPRPVVVTLSISSRCQLRVIADGTEVLGRTVEAGETVPLDLGEELLLLGDNAAAVQFSINGQAGRPLGEPGDALSARIGRDDYQDFLVRY